MDSHFSFITRQATINESQEEVFDLLVIGGGINGAGVARDATHRGLNVALFEQQDFAEGTSSRSSKLIHGGIRYLENLEFKLVFEALSERSQLFKLAPHLVHPLRFVMPVYEGFPHSMNKLSAGMWLYDILALFEVPEMHERLTTLETLQRVEILSAHDLKGSFVYSDAYTDDDRLVIETLRDAVRKGAKIGNYVRVNRVTKSDGLFTAHCEDLLSQKIFTVRARQVVSTVGVWTDSFLEKINKKPSHALRPTKGVHLVFDRNRVNLKDAVVMTDPAKNRIVFAIPRHDFVIIGTTDTDYEEAPENVHASSEDVEYLLRMAAQYFPHAELKRSDILSVYSGIRPLVRDDSSSEGKTSREHQVWIDEASQMVVVAGGKYTTYRIIAKETVDTCLSLMPIEWQARMKPWPKDEPINPEATIDKLQGARSWANRLAAEFSLPQYLIARLIENYGQEVRDLLYRYCEAAMEIPADTRVICAQARFAIHHTLCLNLEDFFKRRSTLFLGETDHGLKYLEDVAEVFRQELSWSTAECEDQKSQYRTSVQDMLAQFKNV